MGDFCGSEPTKLGFWVDLWMGGRDLIHGATQVRLVRLGTKGSVRWGLAESWTLGIGPISEQPAQGSGGGGSSSDQGCGSGLSHVKTKEASPAS